MISLATIGACAQQGVTQPPEPPEPGEVVVNFNMTETPYAPPSSTAVDFNMTESPYAPPPEAE